MISHPTKGQLNTLGLGGRIEWLSCSLICGEVTHIYWSGLGWRGRQKSQNQQWRPTERERPTKHRSHFCQSTHYLSIQTSAEDNRPWYRKLITPIVSFGVEIVASISILLLLAIQVKHCKFAVHLHINIWKIESNPSPLQPLFFERQLLQPSRWVILQRRGLHVSHVNSTAGWYAEYYIPYLSCK